MHIAYVPAYIYIYVFICTRKQARIFLQLSLHARGTLNILIYTPLRKRSRLFSSGSPGKEAVPGVVTPARRILVLFVGLKMVPPFVFLLNSPKHKALGGGGRGKPILFFGHGKY